MSTDKRQVAMTIYAGWLAENAPAIFNALLSQVQNGPKGVAGLAHCNGNCRMKLSGITDVLDSLGSEVSDAASSVADGLGSAVSSVGDFLSSSKGQGTLTALVSDYAASQTTAAQVTNAQNQLALQARLPASVGLTWNPATQTYVPYGNLSQLSSGSWQRYLPFILLGGGALILVTALARR